MASHLHALILAGGSGTRFWPASRRALPKHLIPLLDGETLVEAAAARLSGLVPPERCFVVTTAAQADLVRSVLTTVPRENIIVEPAGRDTAAALGLGAATIIGRDPEAVIVAMPADHVIRPAERFRAIVSSAARVLDDRRDAVVTIGIAPRFPATGYGYIQRGERLSQRDERPRPRGERLWTDATVHHVRAFHEKPSREKALRYLASGDYSWNAGIFIWRAAALLEALARTRPETAAVVQLTGDALLERYPKLEKISIDYAVMEHHPEVLCCEADFEWSDVGSWSAIYELFAKDEHANVVIGADHCGFEARGLVVYGGARKRLIAAVGVEDLVIVDTDDALLVCKRDRAEDVKKLVAQLERDSRESLL